MTLDINTPKGQKSLQQENNMIKYIEKCWNVKIIETNKKDKAICDGFIIKNNIVVAIFESKCRKLSLNKLKEYGSWLVTYEKIKKCKLLSEYLRIPFIGFLYLLEEGEVMYWQITDDNGNYIFEFENKEMETKKTINGGKIIRENSFLPFSEGKIIKNRKKQMP